MQRTHESPMDWQWSVPGGPTQEDSPFNAKNVELQTDKARKRQIEAMASPTKPPQLSSPTSKPFLFNSLSQDLPSPPPPPPNFRTAIFQTPRKPESQSIPILDLEDSPLPLQIEEDTPEPPPKIARQKTSHTSSTSIFANLANTSPRKKSGHGDVPRGKLAEGALRKVQKRRQRNQSVNDFWTSPGSDYNSESYGSDEEAPMQPKKIQPKTPKHRSNIPQVTWAETHRDIPTILSQYLQLGVNVSIACLGIYIITAFVRTIQRDVDKKVREYAAEVQHEIDICNRDWFANRCQPETRLPALAEKCMEWKLCAERDPELIGRARVSAETFAEIINSFIEPISYKTMIFCFLIVFGSIFISNFAFGFFRAKHNNHPQPFIAAALPPVANHLTWQATNEQQHYIASGNAYPQFTPFATPLPAGQMTFRGNAGSSEDNGSPTKKTSTVGRLLGWK